MSPNERAIRQHAAILSPLLRGSLLWETMSRTWYECDLENGWQAVDGPAYLFALMIEIYVDNSRTPDAAWLRTHEARTALEHELKYRLSPPYHSQKNKGGKFERWN